MFSHLIRLNSYPKTSCLINLNLKEKDTQSYLFRKSD